MLKNKRPGAEIKRGPPQEEIGPLLADSDSELQLDSGTISQNADANVEVPLSTDPQSSTHGPKVAFSRFWWRKRDGGSDPPNSSEAKHPNKPISVWLPTLAVMISFIIFHLLLAQHYPRYSPAFESGQQQILKKQIGLVVPEHSTLAENLAKVTLSDHQMEILKAENQKGASEIAMDIQSTYDWYHYKFLMTGAIFTAFLAYLGLGAKDGNTDRRLRKAFCSETTFVGLGAATTIAIMTDIHIREVITNLQGVGIWTRTYVEGLTIGSLGWENTLATGPHLDETGYISQLTSASIHVFTWLLYVLFLFVGCCMQVYGPKEHRQGRRRMFKAMSALTGFMFVMLILAANDTGPSLVRDIPYTGQASMFWRIVIWCSYSLVFVMLLSRYTLWEADRRRANES